MNVQRNTVLSAVAAALLVSGTVCGQSFDPGGMTALAVAPQRERARKPEDVDVVVWPSGLIAAEKTHYLTRSSPTIMIFALANPNARELRRSWLVFDIPEGVSLLATNAYLPWHLLRKERVEREGRTYTRCEVPCSVHPTTFPRGAAGPVWYSRYRPPAIWLTTELEQGTSPGEVYYRVRWLDTDGHKAIDSPERAVGLAVLPPIEARQPKIARCGVMGRFIFNYNRVQEEIPLALTSYIRRMGFNYYMGHVPLPPVEKGLGRWAEGPINNGFEVNVGKEIPEEIRYVAHEADFPRDPVAPWAIYRRHPWIVENLFGELRRRVAAGDLTTVWANWEPYRYLANGDYSQRSMEEFVRWSGLPADEARKGWPLETVGKHAVKWRQFRNWELGQVTRVLAEEMAKIAEELQVDARFAVAMSNDAIWTTELTADSHACAVLPWGEMPSYDLQTWQFFFVANASGPYPVGDRSCAAQVVRSAALSRFLDRQLGADRKVRFGCIYGWDQTGRDGFFLPEQLGFLHMSAVFAGAENSQNYAEWPIWDGRYAREVALANTRIARWEETILSGKKVREHVLFPISPYPQKVANSVAPADREHGGWATPEYLYSYEYRKDGKRLVVVANTWDYGDVFFRVRFPNLPDGAYLLSEPEEKRVFVNEKGEAALSADDLAAGALLHVGATRWGAFLLEAFDEEKAAEAQAVTPDAIRAAAESRRPALEDALVRDRVLYAQDFEAAPAGALGEGAHGERILDETLVIGYPIPGRFGPDLHLAIVQEDDNKALRVVDNDPRGMIYLACRLPGNHGIISFDLTLLKGRPFGVALHPAGLALTLPSETTWKQWFGEPYKPRLVYLVPSDDMEKYPRGKPVDTGIEAETGKTYRIAFEWDNLARVGSITVDGKTVAADAGYVHPNKAVAAASVMFASYAMPFPAAGDNGDFTVDNISIFKTEPRQR